MKAVDRAAPNQGSWEPTFAPPLVGRGSEVDLLTTWLDDGIAGHARLVLIEGDAGIGKTRLLRELRLLAGARGATVCAGRCHEHLTLPYLPFAESLFTRLQAMRGETSDVSAADLDWIGRLVRGTVSTVDRPDRAASDHDRLQAFLATSRAALALAGLAPLVVLIDDLHWMDSASFDLFRHLVFSVADAAERSSVRMVIVATHRPVAPNVALHRTLSRFRREPICRTLRLGGLTDDEVEELLHSHGLGAVSKQALASIMRATQGNPLFVEHVASQLTGGATGEADALAVATSLSLADLRLPEELADAITVRIDRLGPASRELLTTASFLGATFALDTVVALSGQTEAETLRLLEEGMAERLILSEGERFQFAHPQIQHALYGVPSAASRYRMHRRIAECLQRQFEDEIEDHVIEIAHHLIEAGPVVSADQVADYARRAGERAVAMSAWNEAARFYDAAVAAAEARPESSEQVPADLYFHAGFAHTRDMDIGPALDLNERAIVAYGERHDLRGLGLALEADIVGRTMHGGTYGAATDLSRPEELLRRLGDEHPEVSGRLLSWMAAAHYMAGDSERGAAAAHRALAFGRRTGDGYVCAHATLELGLAQWQELRLEGALSDFQQSLLMARQAGESWAQTWSLARIPTVLLGLGRLGDALAAIPEALDVCRGVQNWAEYSFAVYAGELVGIARGEFVVAERAARDVVRIALRTEYPLMAASALSAIASCRTLQGNWSEAEEGIAHSADPGRLFEEPGDVVAAHAWTYRQILHARAGQADRVREELASNPRYLAFDGPATLFSVDRIAALAEIADELHDRTLAASTHEVLGAAAQKGVNFTSSWPLLLPRVLGVTAGLNQRWAEAEEWFSRAIEVAEAAGAVVELARTRLDYAHLLVERGRQGDRQRAGILLHEAFPTLWTLGLRPLVHRASDIAESLRIPLPIAVGASFAQPDLASGAPSSRRSPRGRAGTIDGAASPASEARPFDEERPFASVTAGESMTAPLDVGASEVELARVAQPVSDRTRAATDVREGVDARVAPNANHLSERELQVLRLLAQGRSNREISATLVISVNTVFHHVGSILTKTGALNRTEAAAYAYRRGLMD